MTEGKVANDELNGGCMCGRVKFRIRPPYSKFVHCHCQRCRKATGAAHATNIYIAPNQFGFVFSAALFGLMPGAFGLGPIADRYGRTGELDPLL